MGTALVTTLTPLLGSGAARPLITCEQNTRVKLIAHMEIKKIVYSP